MNIRIGCSGWLYPEWKGIFYPDDLSRKEWFVFYAQHFNSVEINNTFYCFPTTNTINKWYAQVPEEFTYSLKVNRIITHFKKFENIETPLQKFYQMGSLLKEKLESFLFQLSPSFTYNPSRLQNILDNLDHGYRNVLEFRHPSWWNRHVYETLVKNNIIFCSVSGLGLPDEVICINDSVYLRFHGFPLYKGSYTEEELFFWGANIKHTKAKNIWIYFNNTMNGHAPMNALTLKRYLMG